MNRNRSRDRDHANQRLYRQRARLLKQAQQLARSGQHADHASIIPQLAHMDGFEATRVRLGEGAIRAQLDRLCVMARVRRERPVEAPPHASTRT